MGEKADEEGATVVATAQVEELIGPMDEEGEHLSANAAGEDDMVDSLTPPPSRLSAAAASCGQPSAVRVGHQACQAFQTSPYISPSGLGEGGKREREPSAQLTEPKQSRQAGIMRHVCSRVDPQQYAFVRGQKDPCVFRGAKTGIILLHHIDDIWAAGPDKTKTFAQLFEKELPRLCEVQAGELVREGAAVEYLGRTEIRTKDTIITVPAERYYKAVISAAGVSAKDRSEVGTFQTTQRPRDWAIGWSHWMRRNVICTRAR